ncbi:phage tail tape measure protein [Chryseobacterium sp. PTM-20240506]|uniref:phage tail tape measure protein n=1 Tax=Chryseobacterium sp. PTM-20240506 TaxID=3400631 RepID=UPI003AAA4F26
MAGTTITTTGILYINGNQVENTFQSVSRITRRLESELKKLPVGSAEFVKKAEELKRARQRLAEVKDEINGVNESMNKASGFLGLFNNGLLKFGDTFKEVFSADLAGKFFDVIIDKGKETIDQLLKVADAMTDVEKTTGMSTEQVKDLWTEFDGMDTRTSKLDRLKIAEVGGRLGVPIQEMKDFVQQVDKAYVALGDSFEGGLEGVVDQLGKIKGLFNDTKNLEYAEAINKIGSALNTLAASGTSSEGNISQFALRVGALPDALKPGLDKVLGLGAAFEEAGIDAQIASSGFSNFITNAAENIEGFAISMHMSVGEAKNLMNTKPEEFFLRFAQGMKGLDATETAKVYASLKLNSLEVQKAVGAAANKTDEFKKAIKTAGIEMEKMSSLQDEFNKKNNNAPAILEKIKNAYDDIFTSTNVINQFEKLIQVVGWLTGVTSESGDGINVFKERLKLLINIIKIAVAGFIGYNAGVALSALLTTNATRATLLSIVADKAKAAAVWLSQVAILAYNVALGILNLSLRRVRQSLAIFNATTNANGLGVLIGLIAAVVTAYKVFSNELDETAKKKKILDNITKDASQNSAKEINNLDQLYKKATDVNKSTKDRLTAINELKAQYPDYFKNIKDEIIMNGKAEESYKRLRDSIIASARAAAAQKKLEERAAERLERDQKIDEDIAEQDKIIKNPQSKTTQGTSFSGANELSGGGPRTLSKEEVAAGAEYRKKVLNNIKEAQKKEDEEQDKFLLDIVEVGKPKKTEGTGPEVPKNIALPDKDKNKEKKLADDLEKARDAVNKANEAKTEADKKAGELERNRIDEQFKIWEENKQKEWDVELQDYENRKAELQQQTAEFKNQIQKTNDEIKKLERDKKETKNPAAAAEFGNAIAGLQKANEKRQGLIKANATIEDQFFQTHGFNLLRIEEKYITKKYEKDVAALQSSADLERKSAEDSINNISTMNEAREALSKMGYLKLTETELKAIQTLEDAKKALRENADRAYLKSQEDFLKEQKKLLEKLLQDPSLSSESLEKLKKDLEELNSKITEVQSSMKGGSEADSKKVKEEGDTEKEKVDILGFSAKDWETAWKNLDTTKGKLGAVKMVIQALGNAFQAYYQLQNALAEREMAKFEKNNDKKKKDLLGQLNSGIITQAEYNKKLQEIDATTANKKAEIAYKQAKTERALKIAETITNTSLAIMQAYSQLGPIGGTIAAVLIGTLGAIQLGTILSTPLPDKPTFAKGGFTSNQGFGGPDETGEVPAGIVHVNEWVAPAWMLQNPRTAQVIDYLESVRQGKTTPFADGGFSDPGSDTPNVNRSQPQTNLIDVVSQNLQVMSEVKKLLQKIDEEGIESYMVADAKNGKLMKVAINEIETIENRNARK